MSFYVLEVMGSIWSADSKIQSSNPYRITWENQESGQRICELFIKMVGESERGGTDPYDSVHLGVHFYKYEKSFDFGLKPNERPRPISNVYIPSKPFTYIQINKLVSHSLSLLETCKNAGEITAVTEEELAQALKEIESDT